MRKGMSTILITVIALVTAVVGFSIISAVISPATNLESSNNDNFTITSNPQTITLSNHPLTTISSVTNYTAGTGAATLTAGSNYTILDATAGTINVTVYDYATHGGVIQFDYTYEPSEYFSNSLTRTIATYIVPIGLLGVLGLAAMGLGS